MRRSQGDLKRQLLGARRKPIYKKGKHTEKTDEAFGSFQEGEGLDALIGDGDLCEGLRRHGGSGLAKR
jgi:hypothetical protein